MRRTVTITNAHVLLDSTGYTVSPETTIVFQSHARIKENVQTCPPGLSVNVLKVFMELYARSLTIIVTVSLVQSVFYIMAGVESCFLKLSEELK